jgi:hypothetical protein
VSCASKQNECRVSLLPAHFTVLGLSVLLLPQSRETFANLKSEKRLSTLSSVCTLLLFALHMYELKVLSVCLCIRSYVGI